MQIENANLVEDCFDGSRVYVYTFDTPWTRDNIRRLEALGSLEYFPSFARPFFRLIAENGMQAKGVEGETNCRVIFPKKDMEKIRKDFEEVFRRADRAE